MFIETVRKFFRKRGITVALYAIITLILVNTIYTYQYKKALNSNLREHEVLGMVKKNKEAIISNLNNIDMSLRGFLLVGNEAFVETYGKIKKESKPQMAYLEATLPKVGISTNTLKKMDDKLKSYFALMDKVVQLEKDSLHNEALAIIKADHGTAVWKVYVELSKEIDPHIQEKLDKSNANYERLLTLNLSFQVALFLICIPTLIVTSFRLIRNDRKRLELYRQLDDRNRKLIFDSSVPIDVQNEKKVISEIINNLNKTSEFIKGIAGGNYDVTWNGFQASAADNTNAISGQLLHMRNEMKKNQEELIKQQWVSKGLNQLSTLIREYQDNYGSLTDKATSFIIKYLEAHQGSLFILNDSNEEDQYIELVSTYAFGTKKYIEKRIDIGSGILGQSFLEGQPVYLSDVPKNYITITSGLGHANPTCLSIYPLKYNEKVVGLIEVASFSKLDSFCLDFLLGASKDLGAAIATIRNNEKTRSLLEISQMQQEEMRSKEEELRQNLEELEATQEEMKRRERSYGSKSK